jgi:hypothetical protein
MSSQNDAKWYDRYNTDRRHKIPGDPPGEVERRRPFRKRKLNIDDEEWDSMIHSLREPPSVIPPDR